MTWEQRRSFSTVLSDKTAIYTVFLAAMQPQATTVLDTNLRGLKRANCLPHFIMLSTLVYALEHTKKT